MVPNFPADSTGTKKSLKFLGLALFVSTVMTLLVLSPDLWDRYRIVNDVQNSYWMARYQEPTLFSQDYLWGRILLEVDIFGLPLVLYPLSLGWGLLFYPASFIIDHIWLSKLLVFILIPICVIYLFKLGQLIYGHLTGFTLSLLFTFFILASPQSISPASGLQRGFAVPLLLVFIYHLIAKQYVAAGLMIWVSALIYVPNFFLTAIAYALALFRIDRRPFKISLNLTPATITPWSSGVFLSALTIGLILAIRSGLIAPSPTAMGAGAVVDATMYLSFPWLGRAGLFDTGADALNFLTLVIFGVLIYKVVGPASLNRIPKAVWSLLIAGLLMFFLALFMIFQPWLAIDLYYPSRYTRSVLFVVALLFVGLNWEDFVENGPAWFRRQRPLLIFFSLSLMLVLGFIYLLAPPQLPVGPLLFLLGLVAAGLLVLGSWAGVCWLIFSPARLAQTKRRGAIVFGLCLIIIGVGGGYIKILGVKTDDPTEDARRVYEFVATLPEDVLLAGDTDLMDDIPLFSKRSVLFNTLNPGGSDVAILDFFDAYYAESAAVILNFCQRYNVDYLVVNEELLTSSYLNDRKFYHQPHNDRIVEMVAGRSDFVALDLPVVFASGPLKVIECNSTMSHLKVVRGKKPLACHFEEQSDEKSLKPMLTRRLFRDFSSQARRNDMVC